TDGAEPVAGPAGALPGVRRRGDGRLQRPVVLSARAARWSGVPLRGGGAAGRAVSLVGGGHPGNAADAAAALRRAGPEKERGTGREHPTSHGSPRRPGGGPPSPARRAASSAPSLLLPRAV